MPNFGLATANCAPPPLQMTLISIRPITIRVRMSRVIVIRVIMMTKRPNHRVLHHLRHRSQTPRQDQGQAVTHSMIPLESVMAKDAAATESRS